MKALFAIDFVEIRSIGRVELHLSDDELWALSFLELDSMLTIRRRVREREHDVPAALICSVLANINRDTDKHPEPFTLQDFLLKADQAQPEEETPAARDARIIANLRRVTASLGGTVIDHREASE